MKIQSALAIACSALFAFASNNVVNAQYGYEACCSCVPTKAPTTQKPTFKPTMPINTDSFCVTDGGYASEETLCKETFTYKSGTTATKRSGCQSMVSKYKPYVDAVNPPPLPNEGGDASLWCSTASVYDPKKKTKTSWGYCNCFEYGCYPDTVKAILDEAVSLYKNATNVQKAKFKAAVSVDQAMPFFKPQPLDYTNAKAPPCFTDGGKQTGVQCQATWSYVTSTGTKVSITGCTDTSVEVPYTANGVTQPTIPGTSKAKYCATVPVYDPKKSSLTKENWGYCSCLTNLDMAVVNSLIAAFNPLTKSERKEFWAKVK